jgi:hypothetical protein
MHISWNGGTTWQPFQLNLPVVPITDLMIKHNDLIISTMGRSFWIFDDMGLLRQYNNGDESFKIYKPEDAVIGNWGSELSGATIEDFEGSDPFSGINPANGVVMYYNLPKLADSVHVSIEIRDVAGKVVRQFSSKRNPDFMRYDGGPRAEPALSKSKGINRFVWDMRYSTMLGAPTAYIEGSYRGHKASPGAYSVSIKYADKESKADFKILPNPLYEISAATYQEYHEFMSTMEESFNDMHRKVNGILKARTQLETVLKEIGDDQKYAALKKDGEALVKKMKTWDDEMIQRKAKAYDDVDNYENKFTANYLFLINQTESDIPRVNKPSRDRYEELTRQWNTLDARAKEIIETDVPKFSKQLWDAGVGVIRIK